MYLPPQFEEMRTAELHGLMRRFPLATLITTDSRGVHANHLPLELAAGEALPTVLSGHVARANPVWRGGEEVRDALAIFQGPHAYITPSFYPEKIASGKVVPTWNYAVVHARGTLRFIHDREWLRAVVTRLTDRHEAPRPAPWHVTDAPADYIDKMLTAIVGFELTVHTLQGKWKLGQNRSAADQRGIIDGLREGGEPSGLGIADLLERRQ